MYGHTTSELRDVIEDVIETSFKFSGNISPNIKSETEIFLIWSSIFSIVELYCFFLLHKYVRTCSCSTATHVHSVQKSWNIFLFLIFNTYPWYVCFTVPSLHHLIFPRVWSKCTFRGSAYLNALEHSRNGNTRPETWIRLLHAYILYSHTRVRMKWGPLESGAP